MLSVSGLKQSGKLWVIENVPGSPLREPITLCGGMFGLRSYRHRLFESSEPLKVPEHKPHIVRVNRRGENRRGTLEQGWISDDYRGTWGRIVVWKRWGLIG